MTVRITPAVRSALLWLAPFLAILAARFATHSQLAADHPRAAGLLFLWVAADALALSLLAKAPKHRPGLRALLGAIAAGCVIAAVGAAAPVRTAMLDMEGVVLAMGLTVAAYLGWSLFLAAQELRKTRSMTEAAGVILPAALVRFAAYESAMMRLALFSWGAKPHVPDGAQAFAYHKVINPLVATFLVLQVIEIVVVDLLVSHWSETAALVLLALGIWGVLFFIAMMKSFGLYPVLLLHEDELQVRGGSFVDFSLPLSAIASVEPSISDADTRRADVLNAAILSHPNVVLRLSRPLEYSPLFGRPRMVERVAFRLDEPAPFLAALQRRI
ncbi:hypothetical protein [Qipengyuania sp. 483]